MNTIRPDIEQAIKSQRCVKLDVEEVECDVKNGRRNDPRLNDPDKQRIEDFQPLSEAGISAKHQHCEECRESGRRFDARNLGYPVSQVLGGEDYNGTCVGCYWHDLIFFKQACANPIVRRKSTGPESRI